MKIECKDIQKILPLYIDNAVSTEQRIWIETHLINCSKCNNEKELLSKTVTLIKETRERNACFDITWKVAESERSAIKRPYEYIAVPVVLLLIILVITGYLIGSRLLIIDGKLITKDSVINNKNYKFKQNITKKRINIKLMAGDMDSFRQIYPVIKKYKGVNVTNNNNELVVDMPASDVPSFVAEINKISNITLNTSVMTDGMKQNKNIYSIIEPDNAEPYRQGQSVVSPKSKDELH